MKKTINFDDYVYDIKNLCRCFGLVPAVVEYQSTNKKESGFYILIALDKIPEIKNAAEFAKKIKRENTYFHTQFACKIDEDNPYAAYAEVIRYCKDGEFVNNLYSTIIKEPFPEKIGRNQLDKIKTLAILQNEVNYTHEFRENIKAKNLKLVKKLAIGGGFNKSWYEFKQSGKYNPKFSTLTNLFNYIFKRNSQCINDKTLTNDTFSKYVEFEMLNSTYKKFKKEIKNRPEILYSLVERDITDNRSLKNKLLNREKENVADIVKIKVKQIDEAEVANIINRISLGAKSTIFFKDLQYLGEIVGETIPRDTFLLFEDVAKDWNFKYMIDNGYINYSDRDNIALLFNSKDIQLFKDCFEDVRRSYIEFGHPTCFNSLEYRLEVLEQDKVYEREQTQIKLDYIQCQLR